MTSDNRIDAIVAHLREREQQNQQLFDKLREFTDLLYLEAHRVSSIGDKKKPRP